MTAPLRPRILVLDRFMSPSRAPAPRVLAQFVRTISEAMRELRKAGYDAVVLRVEGADEMSLVLQIKGAAPEVPLFALIPGGDSELHAMARESGADQVVAATEESDPAGTMDRLLDGSSSLIQASRDVIAQSKAIRQRMEDLSARSRAIRDRIFDLAQVPLQHLSTLVVEDDPDHGDLLKWAFEKLKLPVPVSMLRNGEEAISYLAGKGRYRDRKAFPLPTLLLLDLHLPRKSGFEILEWIRSRPEFAKLVVFMLSSSPLGQDSDRSEALGANSYFIKPVTLDGLRDLIQVMVTRWGYIYGGLNP